MRIKLFNLRKLWLSLLLLVGATAIAVPTLVENSDGTIEISTVDQLKEFRDDVNRGTSYAGKTVKLTADLDLQGEDWFPIGYNTMASYPGTAFKGDFDGCNHTISNLKVNSSEPNYATAGLFGSIASGSIKNLTLKNVDVTSTHWAGGIVAYTSNGPTIENCKVIDGTIKSTPENVNGSYDNGNQAGGIMGYATAGSTINNCWVENVTITAYRDLGGIVGCSNGTVTNNTAKNVTVTQDLTNGYKNPTPTTIGDIVGRGTATNNVEANGNIVIKSDPVAQIGETKYETIADAVAAANAGNVIEVIKAGDYTLPNISKNVTIEGAVDGVVFKDIVANPTDENNIASIPNGATFKNITLELGNINYHGFTHAGTINMEDCTLNGRLSSYGDMNFTNCHFVQTTADYNMWVYGAGNVVYDQCIFTNTSSGKLLHLYCEDANLQHKVTVKDCKFVNEGSLSKAAVNVKATSGSNALQYELHLEGNNTYEGNFPTAVGEQDNSDHTWILSPLAQVDDRAVNPDNITVYKNDVLIYPNYVAAIGDTKYTTLQGAFDAAEAGQTVTLLKDISLSTTETVDGVNKYGARIEKSIVIDGANYTIDGTATRTIGIKGADSNNKIDVTIKDLNIVNSVSGGGAIFTRGNLNSLTLDNVDLIMTATKGYNQPLTISGNAGTAETDNKAEVKIKNGCTLQSAPNCEVGYAIINWVPANIDIQNSVVRGWACLYAKPNSKGTKYNVENSELISANHNAGATNSFGVIVIEDQNVTANIVNTLIDVSGTNNTQSVVVFNDYYATESNQSTVGSVVTFGEGNSVTMKESANYVNSSSNDGNEQSGKIIISGGIFDQPVPEQYCAEDMIPVDLGEGKYSVKVGSYVAQIGEGESVKKYETLEEAFTAATDGATITLLSDCSGNGISVAPNKFPNGLTVDFAEHTYTITGPGLAGSTGTKTQAFQLQKDNKITFKNGAIVGNNADVKMMIQNYSDLTLDNMVLDATKGENNIGYVLSTNNGNTVIKDTKITAKEGKQAFDADSGWGSYPANNVTVTGSSEINGNMEVAFENKTEGTPSVLTLTSGTFNGNIVMGSNAEKCTVTKSNSLDIAAPADYKWVDNGNETSTLKPCEYICAIGETKYETLADAVAAAGTAETTITLLTEAATDGVISGDGVVVPSGSNITFDLNGLTYNVSGETVGSSGTETNGFQLLKKSNFTFKNGTLKATSPTAQMLIQNYSNLTLEDVNLDGTGLSGWAYALSNNCGTINLIGSTSITAKSGGRAFDTCKFGSYAIPTVNINTTGAITGPIEATGGKLNIENGKFNVTWVTDNNYAAGDIQIKGGVFSEEPAEEYCAKGYVATDNEDEATKANFPFAVMTKEDAGIFELKDWEIYPYLAYNEDKETESVTYIRRFGNTNWQALFVPFDINDVSKLTDRYEFAKIHMVALENDGQWTNGDKIEVYYTKITDGKIYANKPYLIKAKKTGEQSIVIENTVLHDTHNIDPMHTETTAAVYAFTGTYEGVDATSSNTFFAMGKGTINFQDNVHLGAYRWYLTFEPKGDNYAKPSISFTEAAEDATSISAANADENTEIEGYYSVNGVRSNVPVKGMNIVKFKNGKTKKIMIKQ